MRPQNCPQGLGSTEADTSAADDSLQALKAFVAGLHPAPELACSVFDIVLRTVPVGVFVVDAGNTIQWSNPALSRLCGYSAAELQGKHPVVLWPNAADHNLWETIRRCVGNGAIWRGEVLNQTRDGLAFTVQQSVTPVLGSAEPPSHYVVVQEDLTSRKMTELRLLHLAQHDGLTGLANRSLFYERLRVAMEWAIRRRRKIALMLLDLDGFKDINDAHGHRTGDALLVAVARRLESRVRAIDIVARMGGDEFAILFEDIGSREVVAMLAQRVITAFHEPFEVSGHSMQISASAGVVLHPDDATGVDGLFRAADVALHESKSQPATTIGFYNAQADLQAAHRARLAAHVRAAHDEGKLSLFLQPLVELATGKIAGAEALLRLSDASLVNEPTSRIIQVAEDSGIIHSIGDWMLAEISGLLTRWKDVFRRVPLAINFSARQLEREGTVESILNSLSEGDIPPSLVEVEITESVLLQNSEEVRFGLKRLADRGVSLVLDDFGTGYSSLSYLRQHPVRSLKIDISFVQGLGLNQNDEEIVAALIDLAHALGMRVCAEGVETDLQAQFLIDHHCDLAQGYYFYRPLPVEQFEKLLRGL